MWLLAVGIAIHVGFLLSLRTGWLNPLFNDALHRFGPGCDFFSIYAAGVKARLREPVYPIGGHVEQVPYAYAFRYAPLVAYTLGWLLSLLPHVTAYGAWLVVCELALLRNLRLTLAGSDLAPSRQAAEGRAEGTSLSQRRKGAKGDEEGFTASDGSPVAARATAVGKTRTALAAAMWLCLTPYYLELYVGQFTFITASLVFWAYLAWEREADSPRRHGDTESGTEREAGGAGNGGGAGRGGSSWPRSFMFSRWKVPFRIFAFSPFRVLSSASVKGDLFWAAAVGLKMMPLLYLPILLLRRRWGAAVGTVVVLVGTSWLYFQRFPADWKLFTDTNVDPRPSWHAGNQGLMALLYALSGEQVRPYLQMRVVALVLVGLGLAWLTWRAFAAERRSGAGSHRYTDTPSHPHLLYLYAACSAAYLLCYKDVWEHHYVLLLPPLVLMCMQGVSPWIWAPSYLVAALPWLFALYDLPGLGYNEDPQRYWTPAVSLLHHAFKPVAALWLFGAVLVATLAPKGTEREREIAKERNLECDGGPLQHESTKRREHEGSGMGDYHTPLRPYSPARRRLRAIVVATVVVVGAVALARGTSWAAAVIGEQRRVSRQLVWGPELFRLQERREGCGPAALAAVCRYYGVAATEREVAKLAGTGRAGTSMLGLLKAAEANGLAAEGRRFTLETLAGAPLPCILYFHQGHFAVLTGVRAGHFYVADPSLGQRVLTPGELRLRWRGEALVVGPGAAGAGSAAASVRSRRTTGEVTHQEVK